MVAAYEFLGSPSSTIPVMLVGGTNGKGSTAAVASIALSNRGLRVGLYTSPHLLSFAERIAVSDHQTTMKELMSLYNAIEAKLQALNWDQLTFFEATTLLALSYFEARRVKRMAVGRRFMGCSTRVCGGVNGGVGGVIASG